MSSCRLGLYITTKKSSYCNVFFPTLLKIAVIEKPVLALFETTRIENPITVAQNWRFINRCNRRPIAAVSKNPGIGSPIAAFYNHRYRFGLLFF